MINYNIMNLIMDKKALKEWEEKVIKINEEYRNLYSYYTRNQCLVMIFCKNINCKYNGMYQVMYNYLGHIFIYKIGYKECVDCNQTNIRIIVKRVAELSKNY